MNKAIEFMTVREVSKQLHIGVDLVISHIDNGRLQAINVGTKNRRSFRIKSEWVETFIESSLVQTETEQPARRAVPKLAKSKWIRDLKTS